MRQWRIVEEVMEKFHRCYGVPTVGEQADAVRDAIRLTLEHLGVRDDDESASTDVG